MAAEITEERVTAAAARLHDGGWYFSARQLYYAVCADVETPPSRVASGEVGLGVLLILVGALTGQRTLLAVLGLVGLMVLIVGVVTHVRERRPLPLVRVLASSFTDFERRFLDDGQQYAGLIRVAAPVAPDDSAHLLVCDRAETAAVMYANRARLGAVAVAVAAQLPAELAGRKVVTLHDCDPAGCALAADLHDAGAELLDAGINPAEVIGRRRQLLEGAPARLPRDLSTHLDAEQVDWLLSGRRLEAATETPEQLAQRVAAAVARQRS